MTPTPMLPCPFCGAAPRMYATEMAYYIECVNEACATMPSTIGCRTDDKAIAVWNTRAPLGSASSTTNAESAA